MAFNRLLPFHNGQASVALIGLISRQLAAFQSRRNRKRLHGGTRFIGIGYTIIFPESIELPVQRIIIEACQRFFINYSILNRSLLIHHMLPQQHVRITGIVQIEKRITGHCQDVSVIYIHDDAAHILGAVSFSCRIFIGIIIFLQLAFHDSLDVGIQRSHQIIAVHRGLCGPLQIGIVVHIAVFPAVNAAENIIIILLQPIVAHIILAGKTHHIGRHGIIGIYPAVFLFKPNSLNVLSLLFIILQLLEGCDLIISQLSFQNMILRSGILLIIGTDIRLRHIKTLSQRSDGSFHILFLFIHQLTVKHQVIHLFTHRQLGSFGIQDLSPLKRQRPAGVLLLGKHLAFILFAVVPVD